MCLWSLGPREPSKVGKAAAGPLIGRGNKLTSSWPAMYLGSYFDRRYRCERGDKLS